MTHTPREGMRAAFEAFHGARRAKGTRRRETMFARLPDDTYADDSVQRHWWTWQTALRAALAAEEARPDIIERLTYHALERDDLTLDDCLAYLAEGWKRVRGRTERQMVLQLTALLAGAPTAEQASAVQAVDALNTWHPVRLEFGVTMHRDHNPPSGGEWLKKDEVLAAVAGAAPAAEQAGAIPAGWVPLRMEWEPGYPEDVAFGPPRMMERLKKWLDKHFAARVAEANAEQAEPVALDVTLTDEETSSLRDTMGAHGFEAPDAIRLTVGNGHSGYGLYVSLAEYGDEGSSLLKALAAPPAPAPTWPEWAEQILKIVREYSGYDGYDDEDGVDLPEEVREALEELTTQIERLEAKAPAPARQEWQPIETAPTDTEVLIGAWIDGEFKWGRSVRFYDSGNEREGEPACGWVWSIDDCSDSVAENPTHWQPLPAAPITAAPAEGGA